jgi:hypothetical protein
MKRRIIHVGFVTLFFVLNAKSDLVTDWNDVALEAIRQDRTAPPKAARALAILHVAIFDSLNGITRTHQPYLIGGHVAASASVDAAISAAAHHALAELFPAQKAHFDLQYATAISQIVNRPQKESGTAWGRAVAAQILAARANDGSLVSLPPPTALGPGMWIPTPPAFVGYALAQWGSIEPFCMISPSQFRPPGPPELSSAEYAAELNEVKQMGAASNSSRTPEQSQIALFWADGAGTETPPGHWNSIARTVAALQGNNLEQNARLFALLNLAMADSAICSWEAKYYFNRWRPVTAIRNADLDGNAATEPDPNWTSFIVTPPFPDYVSGHSTFSAAAATVLALFYGTDQVPFVATSDALPGVQRTFDSFSAAATEAAISRLYGGIHFRSANEHGLQGGLRIGELVMQGFLLPKNNRSRIK